MGGKAGVGVPSTSRKITTPGSSSCSCRLMTAHWSCPVLQTWLRKRWYRSPARSSSTGGSIVCASRRIGIDCEKASFCTSMPSGISTTRSPAQRISHATASAVDTPTSVKQKVEASICASSKLWMALGSSMSHSLTMMPRIKKRTSISRTTLAIASSDLLRKG